MLSMNDGSNFLLADDFGNSDDRILVFASSKGKTAMAESTTFLMDGTFKSCSKQYCQVYTIHADLGSSLEETRTIPVVYALLPNKKQDTYMRLFTSIKNKVPKWNPEVISVDFEIAAIQALKCLFPDAKITGCNYHFNQSLWRKVQELGLVTDYNSSEDIRLHVRMCAALAHLPLDKVEDGWLCIQEDAPDSEKLHEFFDYVVDQWLDNNTISVNMWNCNGNQHRTNNIVEGWNRRLNTVVKKAHPNVYYLINVLKEDAEYHGFCYDRTTLNLKGKRRKLSSINMDDRIKNTLGKLKENGNLKKCLIHLAYVQKLQ